MPTEPDPWDAVAADWDRDPGPRLYASAAFDHLQHLLAERHLQLAPMTVLDFGAGTGLLAELLRTHVASITALEPSTEMRRLLSRKAAQWENVRVIADLGELRSATAHPETDATDQCQPCNARQVGPPFDLIVCSSVLGFVDDYPATLTELWSLLADGGWLVQWDWERAEDEQAEPESGGSDVGLTRGEIERALAGVGADRPLVESAFTISIDDSDMTPLVGVGTRGQRRR